MTPSEPKKVLRIDLDRERSETLEIPTGVLLECPSGAALATRLLTDHLPSGTDPLAPESVIVFAAGLLAGLPYPGSTRFAVAAKSPLTGCWAGGTMGGEFAWSLCRSEWSAVVLRGRARDGCYVLLDEGRVYFRPAKPFLGMSLVRTREALRRTWGEDIAVLGVGPAGEAGVRFASVSDGSPERGVRGGLGAVFGSKNLKALVIRPDRPVRIEQPEAFLKAAAPLIRSLSEAGDHPAVNMGTPLALRNLNQVNALPSHNFRNAGFEESWFDAVEGLAVKKRACIGCPLSCGNLFFPEEDYGKSGEAVDLPLFPEHLWALGPLLDIKETEETLKTLGICRDMGLDPVSMGIVAAWAAECLENGIDLGVDLGAEAGFGGGPWLASLPAELISGSELGDLLGMGVFSAAKKLGPEALKFAVHFGGQELSYADPRRAFRPLSYLGPAVDPTTVDAGPERTLKDEEWASEMIRLEDRWALLETVGVCPRVFAAQPDPLEKLAAMCRLVIGDAASDECLPGWGRRCVEGIKSFDWREGSRPSGLTLAERFFSEDLAGNGETYAVLDRTHWKNRMETYFTARGWTSEGMPPEGRR
ncbi:MAG: hypothetical protein HY788_06430 [Deltaproteobacteria bacterium]|nr:hypothetical protein [Deltaproteobacteria bacterium]